MKNKAKFLVLLVIGIMAGTELFAQTCTPDPACVDDDENPGQFCPLDLPNGAINVLYDETITVIPPGSYKYSTLEVTILYIEIDSVKNMPPGIDYFPNEDTLYPETAYCIQLQGTPTQLWEDTLQIHIAATFMVGDTEFRLPVVDDTSIVITILETVGIAPNKVSEFRVSPNVPNPFSELTRLDYYVPDHDRIELNIYNALGVLVHHESAEAPPGEHSFRFDGRALQPGTYFYRAKNSKTSISGKLVKSR